MRKIISAVLLFVLCLGLFGCGAEGKYVSVTPHPHRDEYRELGALYASSYREMRGALSQLIADGADHGIIFLLDLDGKTGNSYMESIVGNLYRTDPVAVYAVESVKYELGTNTGRNAIAVEIQYKKSKSEIQRIKQVENMDQVLESLGEVLESVETSLVLRVDTYEARDFTLLVQQFADENPDKIMEIPQVMSAVYPEEGDARVIELSFSYRTDPQELLHMKELVWPVFTAAELYVQGGRETMDKYTQLYNFLMQRYDYTFTTSSTPTFSLLQEGTGDCRAFASVYSAICNKAGLNCRVISGTRNGEIWYWNQIEDDGRVFYVDLLRSYQRGSMELLLPEQMADYSWDEIYYGN